MGRSVRNLTITVSVAAVALAWAAPAGARRPPAALASVGAVAVPTPAVHSAFSPTTRPESVVRKLRNGYGFKPDRLSVGATVGGCSSTNYSFVIDNSSHVTQQLTFDGRAVGAPAGYAQEVAVCVSGGAGASGVFGLASTSAAHLKVTVG